TRNGTCPFSAIRHERGEKAVRLQQNRLIALTDPRLSASLGRLEPLGESGPPRGPAKSPRVHRSYKAVGCHAQASGLARSADDVIHRQADGVAPKADDFADHLREAPKRLVAVLGKEEATGAAFQHEAIEIDEIVDVNVGVAIEAFAKINT